MHRSMKHLRALLLPTLLFVLPGCAAAQQHPAGPPEGVGPCGPLDDALRESRLERRVDLFTSSDEEDAAARAEMGLRRVDAGEPVEVVEAPADCGRVVTEAFRVLNADLPPGATPMTRANMEWVVLRIGPYYVVPVTARPAEEVVVLQWSQILVFRADDLELVTKFLG